MDADPGLNGENAFANSSELTNSRQSRISGSRV
jgi:hypothetical protein